LPPLRSHHHAPRGIDFENSTVFKPAATQEKNVNTMLDHVIAWSGALRPLRDKRGEKR
jgi:hypothetical protein